MQKKLCANGENHWYCRNLGHIDSLSDCQCQIRSFFGLDSYCLCECCLLCSLLHRYQHC